VFARGPAAFAVPPSKIGEVIAYIHNNPVRARVVNRAGASSWTSHRAYVGHVAAPTWLAVDAGLARCGFDDRAAFDRWVDVTPGDSCRPEVGRIRREVMQRGRIELGTPTGGDVAHVPLVGRPHVSVRIDPRIIVDVAAAAIGIETNELCSKRRTAPVVAARRVAIHTSIAFGVSGSDMASALGISPSAVTQISEGLPPALSTTVDEVKQRVALVTGAVPRNLRPSPFGR
jgi:hypothetical protein